jgi:hypothetical protein
MSETAASMNVIDDSRATLQNVASLTDNTRSIIYERNMFILHATEKLECLFQPDPIIVS